MGERKDKRTRENQELRRGQMKRILEQSKIKNNEEGNASI